MQVNDAGLKNARALIKDGKVDVASRWEFTTEDDNALLGDNDWKEYAKWFLAIDENNNPETKAYYKFPFGKNGKVYRSALIAIRQRAGQFGYDEIGNVAGELLAEIDKQEFGLDEEKWFPVFWNGTHKNRGYKKDWSVEDVERIYEANKDKQLPIVVAHPPDDLPIVGFAKGLRKKLQDGKLILEAKLDKLSRWLFEALKRINFDKVSIALDNDLATIRHIGLVENPAIEGMPAVTFENEFVFSTEELNMEFQLEQKQKEIEELKKEIDQLKNENETLKNKMAEFEQERKEFKIKEFMHQHTAGLPPKLVEAIEKIVREHYSSGVAFEQSVVFEAIKEIIESVPKLSEMSNVAQTQIQEKNIEKVVNEFSKKIGRIK